MPNVWFSGVPNRLCERQSPAKGAWRMGNNGPKPRLFTAREFWLSPHLNLEMSPHSLFIPKDVNSLTSGTRTWQFRFQNLFHEVGFKKEYYTVGTTNKLDLTQIFAVSRNKKKNLRLNHKGPGAHNKTQGKPALLFIYLLSQFSKF